MSYLCSAKTDQRSVGQRPECYDKFQTALIYRFISGLIAFI
jgi:hypothetical protein